MAGRPGLALLLVAMLAAAAGAAGADLELAENGREFVRWTEWCAEHGPVALLVWASWAPTADDTLQEIGSLEAAASERGLELVVLAVQEPVEDTRAALGDRKVLWLHDRHGAVLKELRVIRIPALVVVDVEGRATERLEPTASALRAGGAG